MRWTTPVILGLLVCTSASSQENEKGRAAAVPAQAELDSLVKTWSDTRFWILSKGRRTGWQRYQLRWGEYAGEKAIVVDYERGWRRRNREGGLRDSAGRLERLLRLYSE